MEQRTEAAITCEMFRVELAKSLEEHRQATTARNWHQADNHAVIVKQLSTSLVKLVEQTIEQRSPAPAGERDD